MSAKVPNFGRPLIQGVALELLPYKQQFEKQQMEVIVEAQLDIPAITYPYPRARAAMSQPAQALLDLGNKRGWQVNYLGQAPIPLQAVIDEPWLILPEHLDPKPLPNFAAQRKMAVQAAGIPVQGYVIIHEMTSNQSETKATASARSTVAGNRHSERGFRETASPGLGLPLTTAVGKGLLAVGSLVLAASLVMPLLVAALAKVDPILVCVTEQDEWLELIRWNE
jgi:hypothetical protein